MQIWNNFGKSVIAGSTNFTDGDVVREKLDISLRKYFQTNFPDKKIIVLDQMHSKNVQYVDFSNEEFIVQTDALFTDDPRVILTVQHADCFPVLFYDPQKHIISIAHSGLLGTKKLIAQTVIEKMQTRFACKPTNIQILLGPGARECCYHREDSWLEQDDTWKQFTNPKKSKIFIDIPGFIKKTLLNAGISKTNIVDSQICTMCDDKYHSWRRQYKKGVKKCRCGLSFIILSS